MENEVLDYVMNTPGNTNPAILGQMLDANSGTKLPEPTIEDNGKVLGVLEGQYAFVSGGGSFDRFIINFVKTWDGSAPTSNKTCAEITAAVEAHQEIVALYKLEMNDMGDYLYLTSSAYANTANSGWIFYFEKIAKNGTTITVKTSEIIVASDNTITTTEASKNIS